MKISILRQRSPETAPYWESFAYTGTKELSVAGLLDHLNFHDDITDDQGRKTTRIAWEHSCLQGICGACAMVINETPALACETFLKDLPGDELRIRPLSKFPVIRDLIVDRSVIYDGLTEANVYIQAYQPSDTQDHRHQYDAAKCLKCGLCLEVCPNYTDGAVFFGALFANDCYLAAARNTARASEVKAVYDAHFGKSCSKALSCAAVCPMQIPTLASMAKMNRLRKK